MRVLCQHTLVEYYDCDPARLKHARGLKEPICDAVRRSGGTIVKAVFHSFKPYGVSGVVVITESHVTIHTWPEHGYAAVDIFSCSEKLNHMGIVREVKMVLGAKKVSKRILRRGKKGAG